MKMPWRSSKTVENQVQKLISYLGITKEEFDSSIVEEENPKYWKSKVYTKIFTIYPFVNPRWLKNNEGGMVLSTIGSSLNRLLAICTCKNITLADIAHAIDWNPKMMYDVLSNEDDATKALLQVIMLNYRDINPEWLFEGKVPVTKRQVVERKEEPVIVEPAEVIEPANYVERRIDRVNKFINSGHASISYIKDLSAVASKIIDKAKDDLTIDFDDNIIDVIAANCRYVNKQWLLTGEGEMINSDIKEISSDRLLKYIKYKKQVPKPFLKACGLHDALIARADIGRGLSDKIIDTICAHYKDLDKTWLKTGKGEMIIPGVRFDLEPHYSCNIFLDRTGNCVDRIYEYVKANKLTMQQFTSKCGISKSLFSQTKKSQYNDISDLTVVKILKAYPDINPDWLWHGEGMMTTRGRKPKNVTITKESVPEPTKEDVDVKIENVLNIEIELFNNVIIPLSLTNVTHYDYYMFFTTRNDNGETASIGLTNNIIRHISIISGQSIQEKNLKRIIIELCTSDIDIRV